MTTDPGIILFGKKIGIPEYSLPFPTADDSPKTPSINEDDSSEKPQTPGALKKPDKILPCPRCESMNTKFCYYNNSNVNQPRHFCKSCQRYWTAGGTMRNMPVGAGRRKKKNTSSDCRFVISQQEVYESGPQIEFAAESSPTPKNILSFTPTSGVEKPQELNNGNNGIFHSPQVNWVPYNYNPWVPMPIPFYPPPYWNSVPWVPNLGKHLLDRESSEQNEEPKRQRNSVLIPKTLRIDDPDEAAKSSIWVTLGIKNENSSRRDLFKGFQNKGDEKKKESITESSSLLLQANPAAFSRSLCFQERA